MLTLTDLVKTYDPGMSKALNVSRAKAVDGLSLHVDEGEFFTLLGPSGCGKTTTLRSIAGLETPDSGSIAVNGRTLFDGSQRVNVPAAARRLGMVFQSYAIWPHMSVFDNVAFPLQALPRGARPSRSDIKTRVMKALEVTELDTFASRSATKLSGGQQQRLALARALVIEPPLLLLDEPLSNLDAKLRKSMRIELKRMQSQLGLTAVYVTHDQHEALALSSRIAVMRDGRIEQIGTPSEIYNRPANRFVAEFVGETNFFVVDVVESTDTALTMSFAGGLRMIADRIDTASGLPAVVSVRPEAVEILDGDHARGAESQPNCWRAIVVAREFAGEAMDYILRVGNTEARCRANPSRASAEGDAVWVRIPSSSIIALTS